MVRSQRLDDLGSSTTALGILVLELRDLRGGFLAPRFACSEPSRWGMREVLCKCLRQNAGAPCARVQSRKIGIVRSKSTLAAFSFLSCCGPVPERRGRRHDETLPLFGGRLGIRQLSRRSDGNNHRRFQGG